MSDNISPLDMLGTVAAAVSKGDKEDLHRNSAAESAANKKARVVTQEDMYDPAFAHGYQSTNLGEIGLVGVSKTTPRMQNDSFVSASPSLAIIQQSGSNQERPYGHDFANLTQKPPHIPSQMIAHPVRESDLTRGASSSPEEAPGALFHPPVARPTFLNQKLAPSSGGANSQSRYKSTVATTSSSKTSNQSTLRFSPSESEHVHVPPEEITDNDIYCGQEYRGSAHPGNVAFRKMIQENKARYISFGSIVAIAVDEWPTNRMRQDESLSVAILKMSALRRKRTQFSSPIER